MKIIIVGKGASGKDYLRKLMIKRGGRYGVSCTSRPPRVGEVNGEDYHFISKEEFEKMIQNNEFIEYQMFNNWYYGLTLDEFNKSDCMIMNAEGLSLLSEEIRNRCFVIYIDIDRKTRQRRLSSRNDTSDNVMRRLDADDEQFENFKNYDIKISNPDF